ncbi:Tripeptidyl-peptidase II protein [Dioscorea alata]|uniref:Tripeptidyl-peptidase II protein n=1 Tax=Dioscorea alata TaxID=55571 RepID=A0ACB7USG3_DIOAL|nr:Tripeptidyl-peptidase II protein [Dioscorea alata]
MDKSAMPKPFSDHQSWYQSTIATTTSSSSNLIYVYDHALHGFTARLTPFQLKQLKKSHGIVAVYSDMVVNKDTTHTTNFLGLDTSAGLWPASNYGEDMIIGVVDTGVWPESKSFHDDGLPVVPPRWKGECEEPSMCNRKIIGARSFYKGLLANNPNISSVHSSRDTNGHGTHTASTACGNFVPNISFFGYASGTARGMAPHAKLAVYKVLWEEGSYGSDIIAGIDKAISDGVDVLSISLGVNNVPLYKDPVAIAGFAAIEKGILVVTSTGNDGPFLGTLHNGAPWLITVGASTVDRKLGGIIELGNGVIITGQSLYLGSEALPSKLPLVDMGGCENETLLDKVGYKIVVCQTLTLEDVISSVAFAKVAAGLFVSKDPLAELSIRLTQPGAILSPEDGNEILDYINQQEPAPQVTTYSSRGPSMSCSTVLKPDIVAPGALVLASWSENSSVGLVGSDLLYNSYNVISGSSMSCPHVSGLGALLKSVHPDWTPAAIRSAIMTSASIIDNSGSPIIDIGDDGQSASPLAMGSGHIVPNKALDPGLVYDIEVDDYINFLCTMNFTHEQIKTITRTATNCSEANPDLNYPSFITFFEVDETSSNKTIVREFERTVTNVGDTVMTYIAKVMPLEGFRVRVEPDKLIFNEEYKKQRFKLILEGQMENKENQVVYGSLTWIDTMGKYSVRSPIVATTFSELDN